MTLIHALTPRLGIWISNALGISKLITLLLIVCTGFAALAGHVKGPKPDNFSTFRGKGTACELPTYAKTTTAANYAIALLQVRASTPIPLIKVALTETWRQVLYAYNGWESANYVSRLTSLSVIHLAAHLTPVHREGTERGPRRANDIEKVRSHGHRLCDDTLLYGKCLIRTTILTLFEAWDD